MSFGITVTRAIKDAQVVFTATSDSANDAFSIATLFATGDAPAPTKATAGATEKNVTKADTTAKASTEKPTPDASGSSANSSTGSKQANDADAKGKADDAAPALEYEKDIKPLVLAIAKISREKAEGLLQRFGVASAKNLKADQFIDFKDLAEKVIAGEYDPTASDDGALA